jgi:predicted CXXCH cytochrome family protein
MKTKNLFLTLSLVIGICTMGFAQTITGSAHDFSGDSWNPGGEICEVCHTPHNAVTGLTAPLWNHQVTTQTFTLYTSTVSPSFNGTASQPDGSSKLCLSCHDGTTKVDNFGGQTAGTNVITGNANIGTDLSNDHPVSFTYTTATATADGGLFDPATKTTGLGGTITSDLLLADKMQCSSCHDVHNGAGIAKLLRKSNAGSALCLTCHNK